MQCRPPYQLGPGTAAVCDRYPGVSVHRASAEDLPFPDHYFDVSLARPVVHFMTDPAAGLGGLHEIEDTSLTVAVEHPTFEDWWEPFTFGVGPAGKYTGSLEPKMQSQLRDLAREQLPPAPFLLTAHAWAARGVA